MARSVDSKTRLPKTKTPEEWQAFFRAIDTRYDSGRRNDALFRLLYASALRVGEALLLSVKDVDLELMRIHVREGKTGERFVPLPDDPALVKSLNRWLEVRTRWNPSTPLLFLTKPGKPLSTNAARESMKLYGERAGIGHVHPTWPGILQPLNCYPTEPVPSASSGFWVIGSCPLCSRLTPTPATPMPGKRWRSGENRRAVVCDCAPTHIG